MRRLNDCFAVMGLRLCLCFCLCATSVGAQIRTDGGVNPLAIHAESKMEQHTFLKINLQLNLDSLRLKRNEARVFTPILTDGTNSCVLRSVTVNGTWRHLMYLRESDAKKQEAFVVKAGKQGAGLITYTDSCLYAPWMQGAKLWLAEDLCGCGGDPMEQSRRPVEARIEVEEALFSDRGHCVADTNTPPKGKDSYKTAKVTLYLDFLSFPVNGTEILPDFGSNRKELHKLSTMLDSLLIQPQVCIERVSMTGYASPDGPYPKNDELAYKRTLALRDYLQSIRTYRELSFSTASVAEDWEGLKAALEASDIAYREEFLMILATNLLPDEKEERMKCLDGGKAYDILRRELLPPLRRTVCEIHYTENDSE